ncbi:MAG TPA: ATP-binding protein [Actinomycetota bacterium]|nr:ATP-binding protein [Actinomycetota bacterium]
MRERLLCTPESASQARAMLRRLAAPLSKSDLSTAALVLTELVTNAIRHGCPEPGGEIEVAIRRSSGKIRFEVTQPRPLYDPQAVRVRKPGVDRGWGVLIVERLSSNWGLDGQSRTSWAEVPVDAGD